MQLKILDVGSTVVITITFVLFALALLYKGFTHGLLLEAGVFLVSVKLIFMSYKSNAMKRSMEAKLDAIYDALLRSNECDKPELNVPKMIPAHRLTLTKRGSRGPYPKKHWVPSSVSRDLPE